MSKRVEITPTAEKQILMNTLREELMAMSSSTSDKGVTYRAELNTEKNIYGKIGGSIKQAFASFKSPKEYKEVVEKRNQSTALAAADNLILLINNHLEDDGSMKAGKVTAQEVSLKIGGSLNITETSGKSLITGLSKGEGKANMMDSVCQQLADTLNSVFELVDLSEAESKQDSITIITSQMKVAREFINKERGEDEIYREQKCVDRETMKTRAASGAAKYAGGAVAALFTAGLGTSAAVGGIGGGMKAWANKAQQNESIQQTFETDSKTGDNLIESFLERYGDINEVTDPAHYNEYNIYQLVELKTLLEKLSEREDPSDPSSKILLPLKSIKAAIDVAKISQFISSEYRAISDTVYTGAGIDEVMYKSFIKTEDGRLEIQLEEVQVDIDIVKSDYLAKTTDAEKLEFLKTDECKKLLATILNLENANHSIGISKSIMDKIENGSGNQDFIKALFNSANTPEYTKNLDSNLKKYKGNAAFRYSEAKKNSQKGKTTDGIMHVVEGTFAGLVGGSIVNKLKEGFGGQEIIPPITKPTVAPIVESSPATPPAGVVGAEALSNLKDSVGTADEAFFKVDVVKGGKIVDNYPNPKVPVNKDGLYFNLKNKLEELGIRKGEVGNKSQLAEVRAEMKKHGGKISNSILKRIFTNQK